MENKFERLPDTHPERCQGVSKVAGQCNFRKVQGTEFCPMHGGANTAAHQERKAVHDYQLGVWKGRHDQFAGSERVKSLLGEVGIMKLMLEKFANMCKCDNDLIIHFSKIIELNREITKTVVACQNLQEKNKDLIDRNTMDVICDSLLNIVSDYIKDQDDLMALSERIYESIVTAVRGEVPSGTST